MSRKRDVWISWNVFCDITFWSSCKVKLNNVDDAIDDLSSSNWTIILKSRDFHFRIPSTSFSFFLIIFQVGWMSVAENHLSIETCDSSTSLNSFIKSVMGQVRPTRSCLPAQWLFAVYLVRFYLFGCVVVTWTWTRDSARTRVWVCFVCTRECVWLWMGARTWIWICVYTHVCV